MISAATNSPLEAALTGLWTAMLGVDRVDRGGDFYALGGDATMLSTLLANVNALFGVRLEATDFNATEVTLAAMAHAIERARSGRTARASGEEQTKPGASERETPYPLSAAQRRMWFLAKLDPDSNAYSQWRAWEIRGALDVDALRRACERVVQRHEALRTHYVEVDGEPWQRVPDAFRIDFAVVDLTGEAAAERERMAWEAMHAQAHAPIRFASGQPLRMLLIKLGEQRHFLLRGMHHIATDGWSATVFERELSAAYRAYALGAEPALPALAVRYADYAVSQERWMQGEALQRELAYWKAKLAGLTTLELATDRPRPAVQSFRGERVVFEVPKALRESLKGLGRREGATLFRTRLAAFKVLLYRYCGHSDIVVGTPIAARRRT